MKFEIELEKLTDEQLEALRKINNSVVETEVKRRKETTYSQEDIKNNKIYADLYKAYFYIKPMYDNMRNTDVKKTITQSEILPVMEKIFRFAASHGYTYEKFQGEPVEAVEVKEVKEVAEPTPLEKAIEEATPVQNEVTQIVQPIVEPVWEPGGGAEVEQPTPIAQVEQPTPVTQVEQPTPVTQVEQTAPIEEIVTSPIEKMSTEELNKILANIPTVEKI